MKCTIAGLLIQPLQLITNKEFNIIDSYFIRKHKEIICFSVHAGQVFIKSFFLILYTLLGFSIGDLNTYYFILLFATETVNIFIVVYVGGRSITKSIGLLKTFLFALDISGFFLLFSYIYFNISIYINMY